MEKQVFISIVLDTRRAKANGLYPVKLRVFTPTPRIQKLYNTKFEYTQKEFTSIWQTDKTREEHKEKKRELQSIEDKARDTVKDLTTFTFEQFEKKMFRKTGEGENVFYQYQLVIDENTKNGRLGNANSYDYSLKSIKAFLKHKNSKEPKKLLFVEITTNWLNSYENYMLNELKRSRTSVSMYVRPLRAIFNLAISNKDISQEIYPFGKNKYQIPSIKTVKKALTKEELTKLYNAEPRTPEQLKAKDFWFFSYACNGMNVKDIASLRFENLKKDKLVYYRAKTINTAKTNLKPITVFLNEYSKSIIEKYGNADKQPKELIFPIINDNQTDSINYYKIKNFTKFINQNLKKLAELKELPIDISTYWARHTFSTLAIRNGATMEFVSEALNCKTHSN